MIFHWNWRIFRGSVNSREKPNQSGCYCKYHQASDNFASVKVGGTTYPVEKVPAATFLGDISTPGSVSFPEFPVPPVLWRGLKKTCMQPGGVPHEFEYYDFMSTSASKAVAAQTCFLGDCGQEGILFELTRDQSAICADIFWLSKFGSEQEILFAPTKWKLEGPVAFAEGNTSEGSRNYVYARYKLYNLPDCFP